MNRREFIATCIFAVGATAMPWPVFPIRKTEAGASRWQRLPLTTKRMKELGIAGGDGFQYVHALAYAPSNPEIAYLSVDQSGVWRSNDGGRSWEPKYKGFLAYGARSLAVDPLNPQVVVAAGFLGFNADEAANYPNRCQGIYLTTDGGESWRMVRATDFYKQAAKGSLFAFDPSGTPNATRDRTLGIWCASASEGLLKSENGGETWNTTPCRETDLHALVLDPKGPGDVLLASPQGFWKFAHGAVERIGTGLPTYPRSIAVSPAKPEQVHVALGLAGVATSGDGGRNFSPPIQQIGRFFATLDVTDIEASPVDGDSLYLRANISAQPPHASDDGGLTWKSPQAVDPEGILVSPGFYYSSPFAPHPTDPKTCLHVTNGRARIIRTEDGGATWHFSGSGFTGARMADIVFPAPGTMLFGLTDHGLWQTTDNGQTFSELATTRIHGAKSVSATAVSGEHIVAGFGAWEKKGLTVSHDGGTTFHTFPELTDSHLFVAFHPAIPGLVYAGPFASNDHGHTWRRLSETVRAISPDGEMLYALREGTAGRTVLLVSRDRGEHFFPEMELGISARGIIQMVVTPAKTLLLATTRGIYRIDGQQVELRDHRHGLAKDAFGTMYTQCVCYDPNRPELVYAGRRALGYGNGNGVFVSSDGGMNWQAANFNLAQGITVFAIRINPFDSSVYIGTSFGTWCLVS